MSSKRIVFAIGFALILGPHTAKAQGPAVPLEYYYATRVIPFVVRQAPRLGTNAGVLGGGYRLVQQGWRRTTWGPSYVTTPQTIRMQPFYRRR